MINWPKKNRCAVALTFDMDAELLWINFFKRRGFEKPSPMLVALGTYGPRVAMPKILNLLDEYNVKACFFIPGRAAEMHPATVKDVMERGHEIGHHSYTHTNHGTLDYASEEIEFQKGLVALRNLAGVVPKGFRLPGGDMSDNTLAFIRKFNFLYDSSMIDSDIPYLLEAGGRPIVELPAAAELDDWIFYGFNMHPPFEYQSGPHNPKEYLEALVSAFDATYKEGGYLNITMHPQVEGKPARIAAVERFIKHVRKKGKVWITTPTPIAEFWLKHEGYSAPT